MSASDYRFIGSFFRSAPQNVTREEVAQFYSFFGKATHHYRHNLAFRQLMLDGLVWGFISKRESTRLLSMQPMGSFLIRASESSPGSFCLSWKADANMSVRHGLLDVKCFSPPVLAEFLMKKSFLKAVVVPSAAGAASLCEKQAAFGPHLAIQPVKQERKALDDEGYLDLENL